MGLLQVDDKDYGCNFVWSFSSEFIHHLTLVILPRVS